MAAAAMFLANLRLKLKQLDIPTIMPNIIEPHDDVDEFAMGERERERADVDVDGDGEGDGDAVVTAVNGVPSLI